MFAKIKSFVELALAIWAVRSGLFLTERDIKKCEQSRLNYFFVLDVFKNKRAEYISDLMVFKSFLSQMVIRNRNHVSKKIERNIENIFKRIDDDIYRCRHI